MAGPLANALRSVLIGVVGQHSELVLVVIVVGIRTSCTHASWDNKFIGCCETGIIES